MRASEGSVGVYSDQEAFWDRLVAPASSFSAIVLRVGMETLGIQDMNFQAIISHQDPRTPKPSSKHSNI